MDTPSAPTSRRTRRLAGGLAAACMALTVAACGGSAPPAPPTAMAPDPRADYVPGASAIVCYRTLAAPDCYSAAQPGPPNRFIGAYGDRTGAEGAETRPPLPDRPVPLTPAAGS